MDDCNDEICTSTQFLQIRKKPLIDLQEDLERYCNALPVFGFNSTKKDLNLIKSYLLPILVNERSFERTVIKKANQFISFKFGDIQLLGIMKFLGGAKSLDSFLKANKTSDTKRIFPYEWFDHPDKLQNPELPLMMLSTVNFAAATLSKPNTQTMLTYWKVHCPHNKPLCCVQEESFKDTNTTEWIGKHIPISVSISSNLVKEPIFLYNTDRHHFFTSFIDALESLALQSEAILKCLFFDMNTTIKIELEGILEKLTQRHNWGEQVVLDVGCLRQRNLYLLQIQKQQIIDLQAHLKQYCNALPIFGCNSAKYDLNLMQPHLLPFLVN